jgi:hypothetical protein
MRVYIGRHGTRVSVGPFAALLVDLFGWPVPIMWHLFKLMIRIAIMVLAVTWRLGVWTVRWTIDGGKILWGEFRHHDESRDLR